MCLGLQERWTKKFAHTSCISVTFITLSNNKAECICCLLSYKIHYIKNAMMCECGWAVLSHKSVNFGINKPVLYFPYCFYVLCTVLSTVYFHTVHSMFHFLCYWLHLIANAVNQKAQLCFYQRSTMVHPNIQTVAAEREEQHTLSNTRYI